MKLLVELLKVACCGVIGWAILALFCLAMSQDDAELKAGKMPHSGATPDYPTEAPLTYPADEN